MFTGEGRTYTADMAHNTQWHDTNCERSSECQANDAAIANNKKKKILHYYLKTGALFC